MTVAAAAYMIFTGWQAVQFMASGRLVAALLGFAIMVLPLIGGYLVWREIAMARKVQRLADRLAAQGQLPEELPRTPGGRVLPDAAEAEFARCSRQASERPQDAAAWFQLALAYDAARDRKRARAAMRHAVALDEGGTPVPPEQLSASSESEPPSAS